MVLTFTPETETTNITPEKAIAIDTGRLSKIKMQQDIHNAIRHFLINPEQGPGAHWATARFECRNAADQRKYYHAMVSSIRDYLHDIYTFEYSRHGGDITHMEIYETAYPALQNANDIFGPYAIEQHATYVFAALMERITPTKSEF